MAKRAGRVGSGSGQSGHGSKRVIFKRVNRVTGQTGRVKQVGSNGSDRFAMSNHGYVFLICGFNFLGLLFSGLGSLVCYVNQVLLTL